MQKFLNLLLFTTVLAGCTQREETPYTVAQSHNSGSSSAIVNNKAYISSITTAKWNSSTLGKFALTLSVYIDGYQRQQIAIVNIDPNVTTQRVYSNRLYIGNGQYESFVNDTCQGMFFLTNDDEMENTYYLQDSVQNTLNIEDYNKATGAIKGNFDLTFFRVKRDIHQQTQGFGDTLHFTSGKFETMIKQ